MITIDTATGAGLAVGALGVSVAGPGLAISSSGNAFMGDRSGNDLWTIDLGTGAATLLNGSIEADLDGLTFLGNTLYGVDPGNDSLYAVNTTTGAASLVGAGGTLGGLSTESALTTDGTDVEGLAVQTAVVPVPATLALLGIGLFGLAFNARKRL